MKKSSFYITISILIALPFIFTSKINRLRFISLLNRSTYNKKYPKESYFSTSFKNIVPCPKESINIANSLLNKNINLFINEDIINYYVTPGEIMNLYNFSENNHIDLKKISLKEFILLLINDNYYTKDKFIKYYIFILIQNYFLQLIYKSSSKNKIHNLYNKFIMMSYNCIKYNLNYENLFLEFKYKVLNE